jgi:hypothetical protein
MAKRQQDAIDVAKLNAYASAGLARTKRMPSFTLWMRRPNDSIREAKKIEEGKEIFDWLKEKKGLSGGSEKQ